MQTPVYDVCVIGSGAAGGIVTKELCEAGAKVILLEAGQEVKPTQFRSHCWPFDASAIGIQKEMEYKGNQYLQRFQGCDHPEHK